MNAKETLVRAKEIIVERGVNRDGLYINRETGCQVCALGAVRLAVGAEVRASNPQDHYLSTRNMNYYAFLLAHKELTNALPEGRRITSFNDQSESDQEVFDLFDQAIAACD